MNYSAIYVDFGFNVSSRKRWKKQPIRFRLRTQTIKAGFTTDCRSTFLNPIGLSQPGYSGKFCKPCATTAFVSGVIVSRVQGHQLHIKDTHRSKVTVRSDINFRYSDAFSLGVFLREALSPIPIMACEVLGQVEGISRGYREKAKKIVARMLATKIRKG